MQSSRASAVSATADDSAANQRELESRLAAAKTAIASNDAQRIIEANRKLIAIGLRDLADLRMVEANSEAAAELYRESLKYEELADSHLKLSMAYSRLNRLDDALSEADKVIANEPSAAQVWRLKGNVYARKEDYAHAAEALAHALKLDGNVETAYSLAVAFLALHQAEKASMVFDDMTRNYGESGALHVLIGRAYRDAGDDKTALAEFRRALAIDPRTEHAHYFIALLLLMKNEWQSTNPEIEKQLLAEREIAPKDYLTNYLLGFGAWQKHDYKLAQKCLQTAAAQNPDQPDAWLYLGMAAFDQHDYTHAEPWLRKAIALTGTEESRNFFQIRRAYIDLGRLLVEQGKSEEAQPLFAKVRGLQQRSLEQSQQRVSKLMVAGGATTGMGAVVPLARKDIDRGSETFNTPETSALSPAQRERARTEEAQLREILGSAFNDLGSAEAHEQDFAAAFEAFQTAAKWQSDVPNLQRNLGLAAVRLEKYDEAATALSKHVALHPDDGVARAMLGVSEYTIGEFAAAAKAFSGLNEQAADDPRLALPWAESLTKIGDLKQAAVILKRVEAQPLPPETLLVVGQLLGDAGHYDDAIAAFCRALDQQPNLARAHYDAGLAYLKSDRPAQAAAEFQHELALDPGNVNAKYNLAYTLIQQSETQTALTLLKEVTASHPEHADAQYQLGKLLLDSNDVTGAIEHLEIAARLAPDKDFVHYQLQSAYRRAARIADADRELQIYKAAKSRGREAQAVQR